MRIVIDETLCTGHARCVAMAPELFTDDDRGYGQVIGDGTVGADMAAQAALAVNACPERALSVVE